MHNKKEIEMGKVLIDGNSLNLEELVQVAREYHKVELKEEAVKKINESRKKVEFFLEKDKNIRHQYRFW
jgi:histidine ammonia-lyase